MGEKMKLAIEGISIFTAVGVVVSVCLYTYVFGLYGISYLSIASFADMLRDSITVLVIGMVSALGGSILHFFSEAPRLAGFYHQEARGVRLMRAFQFALGACFAFVAIIHVVNVMLTAKPSGGSREFALAIVALMAILTGLFYWIFSHDKAASKRWEEDSRFKLSWSNAFYWTVFVGGLAGFGINSQMVYGIAADLYPVDKELCRGHYIVTWLGDARMVARCTDTKRMVVKIIK